MHGMTGWRPAWAAMATGLACVCWIAVPGSAWAGEGRYDDDPAAGLVVFDSATLGDDDGKRDRVTAKIDTNWLVWLDADGEAITPAADGIDTTLRSCTFLVHSARCGLAGMVKVWLGEGNDVGRLTGQGGGGPRTLVGGPGKDVLWGGPGFTDDVLVGSGGDDVIHAAGWWRDVVDCGPGVDTVYADATDELTGCEVVELS